MACLSQAIAGVDGLYDSDTVVGKSNTGNKPSPKMALPALFHAVGASSSFSTFTTKTLN
jgi:hypothetical protein